MEKRITTFTHFNSDSNFNYHKLQETAQTKKIMKNIIAGVGKRRMKMKIGENVGYIPVGNGNHTFLTQVFPEKVFHGTKYSIAFPGTEHKGIADSYLEDGFYMERTTLTSNPERVVFVEIEKGNYYSTERAIPIKEVNVQE